MSHRPLADDIVSLFERLDDQMQRVITGKAPAPEVLVLLSDMRLLRTRMIANTSPQTGKATDTWTRNGAERLAKISAYLGSAQSAYVPPGDDEQPTDTGRMVIELVKARREAVRLVEFLDAYITSFLPIEGEHDTLSA